MQHELKEHIVPSLRNLVMNQEKMMMGNFLWLWSVH